MVIDSRKLKKIKRDFFLFATIFSFSLALAAAVTFVTDDPGVSAALALSSDERVVAELAILNASDDPLERKNKIAKILKEKLDPDTYRDLCDLYMGKARYGGDYNAISP